MTLIHHSLSRHGSNLSCYLWLDSLLSSFIPPSRYSYTWAFLVWPSLMVVVAFRVLVARTLFLVDTIDYMATTYIEILSHFQSR